MAARLAAAGWRVLARRLRVGRGELDIVAVDPGPPPNLVVVEVRYRTSRSFGLVEETFDHAKRRQVTLAAQRLLEVGLPGGTRVPRLALRVDLVVVEPPAAAGEVPRVRHHRHVLGG